MPFALICKDKPGALEIRKANRDAHLAYAKDLPLHYAGPLLEEGEMIGSLLIINSEDRAEVEAIAANDPYAQAGLFASVEIFHTKKVFG